MVRKTLEPKAQQAQGEARTFEGNVLLEGIGQRGKVLEEGEGPVIAVREQAEVGERSLGRADPAFLLREEVACGCALHRQRA